MLFWAFHEDTEEVQDGERRGMATAEDEALFSEVLRVRFNSPDGISGDRRASPDESLESGEPGEKRMSETAVPDLYELAFMPGCFRCPKCGFVLTKQCINAELGIMGTREQDRESEPCPNDGTMMVHVSYREQLVVYADRLKEEFDRLDRRRAAMVAAFGGMEKGSAIWGQGQYEKGFTAGIQAALTAFDATK